MNQTQHIPPANSGPIAEIPTGPETIFTSNRTLTPATERLKYDLYQRLLTGEFKNTGRDARYFWPPGTGFTTPEGLRVKVKYVPPDNLKDLARIFRLRHRVYCEERRFIDKEIAGSRFRLELDEYDRSNSMHFLVLDTRQEHEERAVATVRLVRFTESKGFPTGKYHPKLYERIARYDKNRMAEVSRLCIDSGFRGSLSGCLPGFDCSTGNDLGRRYPVIMLTLLREMYRQSREAGITHWISSMEDSLYRYLRSFSMVFDPLDDTSIEYFGKVKTFITSIEKVEQVLASQRSDLYRFFKS